MKAYLLVFFIAVAAGSVAMESSSFIVGQVNAANAKTDNGKNSKVLTATAVAKVTQSATRTPTPFSKTTTPTPSPTATATITATPGK